MAELNRLKTIRDSLRSRRKPTDLVIIDERGSFSRQKRDFTLARQAIVHDVRFMVAPKVGIYDIDVLNDFLNSLKLDGFTPDAHPFQESATQLEFGSLGYREDAGTWETTIATRFLYTHRDAIPSGLRKSDLNIKKIESGALVRTIRVNTYPDAKIAGMALVGDIPLTHMGRDQWEKYSPRIVA